MLCFNIIAELPVLSITILAEYASLSGWSSAYRFTDVAMRYPAAENKDKNIKVPLFIICDASSVAANATTHTSLRDKSMWHSIWRASFSLPLGIASPTTESRGLMARRDAMRLYRAVRLHTMCYPKRCRWEILIEGIHAEDEDMWAHHQGYYAEVYR